MDNWLALIVAAGLLVCSVGWMVRHVRVWRQFRGGEADSAELEFRRRQFRRRMQISAMLTVVAIAMLISSLLPPWPRLLTMLVIVILLLTMWIAVLALADIVVTRLHFKHLHNHYIIEQAKLKAELQRIQSVRGNGKAKKP